MVTIGQSVILGYSPAMTYAGTVGTVCDGMVSKTGDGRWHERYPVLAAYFRNLFDYATKDAFLALAHHSTNILVASLATHRLST